MLFTAAEPAVVYSHLNGPGLRLLHQPLTLSLDRTAPALCWTSSEGFLAKWVPPVTVVEGVTSAPIGTSPLPKVTSTSPYIMLKWPGCRGVLYTDRERRARSSGRWRASGWKDLHRDFSIQQSGAGVCWNWKEWRSLVLRLLGMGGWCTWTVALEAGYPATRFGERCLLSGTNRVLCTTAAASAIQCMPRCAGKRFECDVLRLYEEAVLILPPGEAMGFGALVFVECTESGDPGYCVQGLKDSPPAHGTPAGLLRDPGARALPIVKRFGLRCCISHGAPAKDAAMAKALLHWLRSRERRRAQAAALPIVPTTLGGWTPWWGRQRQSHYFTSLDETSSPWLC